MIRLSVFLALAMLLAGCASEGPTSAGEDTTEAVVVTRADDVASLTAEDPASHVHDYWNGAERLVLIDSTEDVARSCTCDSIPVRFRPGPEMIVPLGTSHLEVRVAWDTTGHGTPELWVKPAPATAPIGVGPLENGEMLVVPTTNEEADPPHQILSRWEIWIVFPNSDAEAPFELTGTVKVAGEAVRGLPIPPLPPHPDPWEGQTEILLLDEGVALALHQQGASSDTPRACFFSCLPLIHRPTANVTVPFDAREIVVTLEYEMGMPMLRLRYHDAASWELREPEATSATPTSVSYRIPVDPLAGDSPYASHSLWEFLITVDQPTPELLFAGGYQVTAIVTK